MTLRWSAPDDVQVCMAIYRDIRAYIHFFFHKWNSLVNECWFIPCVAFSSGYMLSFIFVGLYSKKDSTWLINVSFQVGAQMRSLDTSSVLASCEQKTNHMFVNLQLNMMKSVFSSLSRKSSDCSPRLGKRISQLILADIVIYKSFFFCIVDFVLILG